MHARGKVAYIHPVCLPLNRKGPSNLAANTGIQAPQTAYSSAITTLNFT